MLHEFALDPECLSEWSDFVRFMEAFGISKGRLISQFPKYWSRLVRECCRDFTFIQRQRMEDYLKDTKITALVKSGRPYDGRVPWPINAFYRHADLPFHAVITKAEGPGIDRVFHCDEADKYNCYWEIPNEKSVLRTVQDIGDEVAPLLKISKRIVFVDKYFDRRGSGWKDLLQHFIQAAVTGRDNAPSFEYHSMLDREAPSEDSRDEFKRYCDNNIAPLLPTGVNLEMFKWEDKHQGGGGMHARMILTERGGIRIDWGLDAGYIQGQQTHISLMDESLWKKELEKYQHPSNDFDLVYSIGVNGIAEY